MKIKTLEEILKKKSSKTEFAILTNLENGDSEIYFLMRIARQDHLFLDHVLKLLRLYLNLFQFLQKLLLATC